MSREHPAYRDNLEDLLTFFDGKRVLSIKEVARYTGKEQGLPVGQGPLRVPGSKLYLSSHPGPASLRGGVTCPPSMV